MDGTNAVVSASRGAWLSVLLTGCALVVLARFLPDSPAAAVWICTQLVGMAIATDALTRRAAVHRSGWWVLLTSCGVGAASSSLYLIPPAERSDWAWVVALAVRYALLLLGMVLLLEFRRAQSAEQAFLDAGIVAAGLAIVGWTFLVEPALSGPTAGAPHPGATYSYIALDLLMLACLVRIMFGVRSRTPSMLLLAAAGGVVVLADAVSTLSLPHAGLSQYQPGGLIHLAWQLSAVLVTAAALHPSFADGYATRGPDGLAADGPPGAVDPRPAAVGGRPAAVDPGPGRDGTTAAGQCALPPIRFVAFVAIALAAPVVPLLGLLYTGHDVPDEILPALAGSTGLTAVLLVLLVGRLGLVARLAARRAQAMNVQAATLVVQSTALQQALEEQQVLQRELAHQAQHDPLTGLANRSVLLERLERALADAAGRNRPQSALSATPAEHAGTLLLLDLDGFKEVNNTLGHPAGDELLVQVADRLRAAAGEEHTVARLGGDEFAVLMAGADEDSCWHTADRVVEALRRPFPLAERQVRLAASGGLLPLGLDVPCPISTLRDADLALYAAKQAGKNQVVEFRPKMREARLRYSQLAASVRAAVSDDALSVLYQPIVDLASGRPVALEALVRWRAADGRQIPPDQFIAVAEDIGLVGDIGLRVLRDACAQASAWHRRYDVALSVNVSAQQIALPGFADSVLAVLDETALPAPALILEITETALVGASALAGRPIAASRPPAAGGPVAAAGPLAAGGPVAAGLPGPANPVGGPANPVGGMAGLASGMAGLAGLAAQESLHALRRHGIRVAVDDFGAGYSSLSCLHRLPVDILKLDRAITATLDSAGARGTGFVGAVLGLGAGLGVPTVGEGVETARQADLLRELACPMAQGYHFAAPGPAAQVTDYLATTGRVSAARAARV
jgi:diguanylate cyclase (GGDEF)-like protein